MKSISESSDKGLEAIVKGVYKRQNIPYVPIPPVILRDIIKCVETLRDDFCED